MQRLPFVSTLALALVACGPSTEAPDGSLVDGGLSTLDAGGSPDDAGLTSDAGESDAGPDTPDAGEPVAADAGAPDAGSLEVDAGPPRCSGAPACGAVEATPTEHQMRALDGCSVILQPPATVDDARVDALAARMGGALSVTDVLGHLNRVGRPGISSRNAGRMENHDWVGFRWNDGDENVSYWYPQGITGSSDATESGRVGGRRLLLVSWYHRTDERPTKGARLSLVDFTDPSDVRYRHLLLVTPTGTVAEPSFAPTETGSGNALHAGGIVWYGDLLYVADTTQGFRVFDLSRILEPSHTDDTDRVGLSGARSDAHGYRYAVPQIARYRLDSDSCGARFSFAGLDRSVSPPVIVSGEYVSDSVGGPLARWAIEPSTGWLATEAGRVYAVDGALPAQSRMQGGLTYEGVYYISSSSQTPSSWGRLYRSRPGLTSAITAWPYGCEDLYVERAERLIWTPAEHPGARDTLGIPMQGR